MNRTWWAKHAILASICLLIICAYVRTASSEISELGNTEASGAYYNLLIDGFRAGQLNLKKEAPAGLQQLADPYDPAANGSFKGFMFEPGRLHDLSYYHGKLYLYFGVAPALVLFWPYEAITGRYLSHQQAVAIFTAIGFITSAGLLYSLWRRYFNDVSASVVAAGIVALGLATSAPVLLQRPDVWEVPISCGYAMVMLTLAALWCAMHEPARRGRWLILASLAYGVALGARPSLLFGSVILLGPVIQTGMTTRAVGGRRWGEVLRLTAAAAAPVLLIGLGLLLYNHLRFGDPFEFGQNYQLAGDRQHGVQHFGWSNLKFNFEMYFLAPGKWSSAYPYLQGIAEPQSFSHKVSPQWTFGILPNIPFVLLALGVPLIWRNKRKEDHDLLRNYVLMVAAIFFISAFVICLFYGSTNRYEMEFIPPLTVMAVFTLLGLEHALAHRAAWRNLARCVWGALLVFSVAFNLLMSFEAREQIDRMHGQFLFTKGRYREAVSEFEACLRVYPHSANLHCALGNALAEEHQMPEALVQFQTATELDPDLAEAHFDMGMALLETGHSKREAWPHFKEALRRRPDWEPLVARLRPVWP